jgi:molecular chaperone GrpE
MANDEQVSKDVSQAADTAVRQPPAEEKMAPEEVAGEELSSEKLALMLEDARAKADEHWDALLRAKAEMDNLRKRAKRDVENAHKYGIERLVGELLPVKDSLELGLSAADDEQVDVAKLREGMELTLKMLSTAMEKFGVELVDPEGEKFDPERHQAMTMQETDSVEPGTVVSVIQKGYVLNNRLVRPALVIVAKETAAS